MNFKKALEIYKEKYSDHSSLNVFAPKVYMLRLNTEETFNFTTQTLSIPPREEWEAMKAIVDEFYNHATDEEISIYNQENYEQIYGDLNKRPIEKKRKKEKGFIYFLLADNGLVKIGKTKNLKQRLDHFTTKLPYKLTLVHSIETNDTYESEQHYHSKFSSKRKRGEWFELSHSDLEEVKRSGTRI